MKKFLVKTFLIGSLLCSGVEAGEITLPSPITSITIPDDGATHMIYLYTDVSYSQLQDVLSNGQELWIYYFLNDSKLMNAKYSNVPFLITVNLKKDDVVFWVKHNEEWNEFSDFGQLSQYVNSLLAEGDLKGLDSKFNLIENYLNYYDNKLKAGGLYHIRSVGGNLIFKFVAINNSQSQNEPLIISPSTSSVTVESGDEMDVYVTVSDPKAIVNAQSSDPNVAAAKFDGGILTITGISEGNATITLTANDYSGGVATATINVIVIGSESASENDIYPPELSGNETEIPRPPIPPGN